MGCCCICEKSTHSLLNFEVILSMKEMRAALARLGVSRLLRGAGWVGRVEGWMVGRFPCTVLRTTRLLLKPCGEEAFFCLVVRVAAAAVAAADMRTGGGLLVWLCRDLRGGGAVGEARTSTTYKPT